MCEMAEFLDHLAEYPTADTILRLRYLQRKERKINAESADPSTLLANLQKESGAPVRKMPEQVRQLVAWAEAEMQKLNGRKKT